MKTETKSKSSQGKKSSKPSASSPADWPSNAVELSGYAGMAPSFVRYDEQRMMARFTLGTHQLIHEKNGKWVRETVWHTVVAWNQLALKAAGQIQSGSYVHLKGRLRSRKMKRPTGQEEIVVFVYATALTVNLAA